MASPYEDRVSIATPEGVAVELVLAGLGSRFVARLLDSLVQGAFIIAWIALIAATGGTSVVRAAAYIGLFAGWFLYDIVFEVLASGRTPGKRWTGLRVVREGGGSVGWGSSAVRNLVRLFDILPGFYLVGAIAIVVTSRSQRVGDLVAGTLVVRERRTSPVTIDQLRPMAAPAAAAWPASMVGWDVSAVTADDVAVVRRFLQRRHSIDPEARQRLGLELAARLWPKIAGAPTDLPPELFLEQVVAAKDARA